MVCVIVDIAMVTAESNCSGCVRINCLYARGMRGSQVSSFKLSVLQTVKCELMLAWLTHGAGLLNKLLYFGGMSLASEDVLQT